MGERSAVASGCGGAAGRLAADFLAAGRAVPQGRGHCLAALYRLLPMMQHSFKLCNIVYIEGGVIFHRIAW